MKTRFLLLAAFSPLLVAQCRKPPTTLELISDPLLVTAIHSRAASQLKNIAANGASALSQDWIEGRRGKWFIENQRGGADLIEAGVVLKDRDLVDKGLQMFEWGFARQSRDDGSFPESSDAFHSVSIFVIDVGRSLLAIRERQPQFAGLMPRVEAMILRLRAAADWLLRPEVLEPGKERDQGFTHRKWILAGAFGQVAKLTGDRMFANAAARFANEGIALQRANGVNPEKGGFDVSYQMVGVLQAARYYPTLDCATAADLMASVRRMMVKACDWEKARIASDGDIDITDSTRMGKEPGRSGTTKTTNYKELIQAFSYAAQITERSEYKTAARKLARFKNW